MPAFPQPGCVTICEINRDLITAEILSDDRADIAYGNILGMVFSPVPFQPEQLMATSAEQETEQEERFDGESVQRKGLAKALQGIVNYSIKRLLNPNYVSLLPEVDLKAVSWHQHKHVVAFISGPNLVIVRDFEDSEGKDPCFLASECQRDIKVLEWRPNGGKSLSVACKDGICIWAASYPGNAASVRSGAASSLGTLSRGSGTRWTLIDFLRSCDDEQVTALSWSPNGRYPNKSTIKLGSAFTPPYNGCSLCQNHRSSFSPARFFSNSDFILFNVLLFSKFSAYFHASPTFLDWFIFCTGC